MFGQEFWLNQAEAFALFLALGFVFWLLSRAQPINPPAPYASRALGVNLLYQALGPFYGWLLLLLATGGLVYSGYVPDAVSDRLMHGAAPLNTLALWLQLPLLLLFTDMLQYAMHRWLHGKMLWRFHAIHHAPTQLEWHHANRFHPINILLYTTLVTTAALWAGFPLSSILLLAPFNLAYSLMVHANVNWSFGPLRYVLASPVFHRWHHAADKAAYDKNFAPTFPFIDLLFGTFYMPKGALPTQLGAAGARVPEGFVGQMLHPFRTTKT